MKKTKRLCHCGQPIKGDDPGEFFCPTHSLEFAEWDLQQFNKYIEEEINLFHCCSSDLDKTWEELNEQTEQWIKGPERPKQSDQEKKFFLAYTLCLAGKTPSEIEKEANVTLQELHHFIKEKNLKL